MLIVGFKGLTGNGKRENPVPGGIGTVQYRLSVPHMRLTGLDIVICNTIHSKKPYCIKTLPMLYAAYFKT